MKQILRYSLVALLAMVFGNVMAEEVTLKYSGTETTNMKADGSNEAATVGLEENAWSVVAAKGAASNAPGLNKAGDIRLYWHADGGNTITVSSLTNATISSIAITFTGDNYSNASVTVNGNAVTGTDGVYNINSTSFVLGNANTSNAQVRISQIVITYAGGSTVTVAAPSISGTTPFVGSTEVTITTTEEGAKIYYTTDGVEPTNNSLEYTAPFTITETTTVKAIAEKNGVSSSVASKTFTAVPTVANVAALNALANNDAFAFAGEALVVYVSGKYAYIKDETGSSLVFDNGSTKLANLALGKKIAANWTGKVSIYKNLFEAVPDAVLTVTDDEAVAVTYPVAEISDVTATNMNQVVVLKDVVYSALNEKNFTITKGETEVKGYNQFGLEIAAPTEGKSYDITGVISVYNDDVQFQPIEIQEVSWTIAGTAPLVAVSWDPTDASADMTSTDGVNFTYVKEGITLEKGVTKEFKVARNHSWNEAYPSSNYAVNVDETAEYKVTITFNALTKNITVETEKTGSGQVGEKVYSVIGTINGNWDTDTDMTKGDDGLYKAEFTNIAKGTYKLKVRVNHDWNENYGGGDDPDGNSVFDVESDGSTVIVTFNEETKVVAITVSAATGISTAKVVELNGAVYNVAGQMVTSSYKGLVIKNGKKMIQK